jgi:hypothetical protein
MLQGFLQSRLKSAFRKVYGRYTTSHWVGCCLMRLKTFVFTHWFWLRITPFIWFGNKAHGGCDRSTGGAPDPTSGLSRGPCSRNLPALYFIWDLWGCSLFVILLSLFISSFCKFYDLTYKYMYKLSSCQIRLTFLAHQLWWWITQHSWSITKLISRRVWPVSSGCLLLLGTWSHLRYIRESVFAHSFLRFVISINAQLHFELYQATCNTGMINRNNKIRSISGVLLKCCTSKKYITFTQYHRKVYTVYACSKSTSDKNCCYIAYYLSLIKANWTSL